MRGVLHGGRGPHAGWVSLIPLGGLGFGPCHCAWVHPQPLSPGPNPEGQHVVDSRVPHRPSQRRAVSSPRHPPRCTSAVVTRLTKRPSVLLETVTAPRPEKHVLCADGHVLSSSRRGPGSGSRGYAINSFWQQELHGHGMPALGDLWALQRSQGLSVTDWHPGQSATTDWRHGRRVLLAPVRGQTV